MRKHTKRKVYGLIYDPIAYVKQGMSPTPETNLDKVRFKELCAIEALAKGNGGINEWRDLTEMLNIAETMVKSGIGPEALQTCQQAQAELPSGLHDPRAIPHLCRGTA